MNQKPTQGNFNGQRVSDQSNLGFLVIKVIIHSVHSATAECKNRTRLGFKQYNVILTLLSYHCQGKEKVHLKEKACKPNIVYYVIRLIYNFITIKLQKKLMKMVIATELGCEFI